MKLTQQKNQRAKPRSTKGNIITIHTNTDVRSVPKVIQSKLISHNTRERNTKKATA